MSKPTSCPACKQTFPNQAAFRNHARYSASCTREARMWGRINKNGPNGCWIWTGMVNSKGYGAVCLGEGKKMVAVHRYLWQQRHGPIPASVFCLHRCDTPRCVNPDHLFLGDDAANTADKMAKGRFVSKLKPEQVKAIRAMPRDVLGKDIAAMFGISESNVSSIRRGDKWKHLL